MSIIIKTNHEKDQVKRIETVSRGENTIYDRCQFSSLDGTDLGSRECLEERLLGGERRIIRRDFDENGRLIKKLEVVRDRYGNKSQKIMIIADGTIDTDYSVIAKFKGKKKPLYKVRFRPDGAPASMSRFNYAETGREESREYFFYNDDSTVSYVKCHKDGKRTMLFAPDGRVLSDIFELRTFRKVDEKQFSEPPKKIFKKGQETPSLMDKLRDRRSL